MGIGNHRGYFSKAPLKCNSGNRLRHTLPKSFGADLGRRDVATAAPAGNSQPAPAPGASSGTASSSSGKGQHSKHGNPAQPLPALVEAVLRSPDLERPAGSDPLQLLRVTEAYWSALKAGKEAPPRAVIHIAEGRLPAEPEYDVAVCGGTLGVFLALRLQVGGAAWRLLIWGSDPASALRVVAGAARALRAPRGDCALIRRPWATGCALSRSGCSRGAPRSGTPAAKSWGCWWKRGC